MFNNSIKSLNEIWKDYNEQNNQSYILNKEKIKNTLEQSKENESLMKKYIDSKDLFLIPDVSKAFIKEDDLKKQAQRIMKEVTSNIKEYTITSFTITPKELNFLLPLLDKNEKTLQRNFLENSKKCLSLYSQNLGNNQVRISINAEEKYKSKLYLKLELKENNIWELVSKEIQEFDFTKGPHDINTLKFSPEMTESYKNTELKFEFKCWRISSINSYKKNIMRAFIKKIEKDIDQIENEEGIRNIDALSNANKKKIVDSQIKKI